MITVLIDWIRRGGGLLGALFLTNQNEKNVLSYTLPSTPETTKNEVLEFFKRELYGAMPSTLPENLIKVVEEGAAFNDTAYRKQYRYTLARGGSSVVLNVLVYLPKRVQKPLVILAANFNGNHSLTTDAAVLGTKIYSKHLAGFQRPFRESSRGAWAHRFPIETIVSRGYAVATFYYGDADPDYNDGFKNGVHALYPELQNREDNFASLGAWSWSMSRVVDLLVQEQDVDSSRIALYGFSRLGKSALWAAANDNRVFAVIADGTGKAGASLSSRNFGETLSLMCYRFPHWFPKSFRSHLRNRIKSLVDQHILLSCIYPRPLLLVSGKKDWWSDPYGTKLALSESLRLNNSKSAYWQFRSRGHEPQLEDWAEYLNFLDQVST